MIVSGSALSDVSHELVHKLGRTGPFIYGIIILKVCNVTLAVPAHVLCDPFRLNCA